MALSPGEEWLENPFHLRSKTLRRRMKDGLLVPAEVLFEGVRGGNESLAVQRALGRMADAGGRAVLRGAGSRQPIRMSILQAEVVAYEIDAGANDDNVIEIFARLNQQGVRLRPGDLAAARLTGQMANFRTRSRAVLTAPELRGFSAPEGVEEGSRSGAFVDTDLLIRAALFLGGGGVRYRDAEKRKSQAHYLSIDSQLGSRRRRVQELGRPVSQRRCSERGIGSLTDTCCSRRRSRRRVATSSAIAGSGGRSRPACGATTPARWTPSWPGTPVSPHEGDIDGSDRARQAAREAPRQRRSGRRRSAPQHRRRGRRSSWRC